MTLAGIHAGQEGIAEIGEAVDTMKLALVKAEEAVLLTEEVSHRWRRFAVVIVAIGVVIVAIGLMRSRRKGSDDGAPEDA